METESQKMLTEAGLKAAQLATAHARTIALLNAIVTDPSLSNTLAPVVCLFATHTRPPRDETRVEEYSVIQYSRLYDPSPRTLSFTRHPLSDGRTRHAV